jgi:hypothetical protein
MAEAAARVRFPAMKPKRAVQPAPVAPGTPPPTHEQIAALAHAIWIDRGRPEGRELDNWLEAERQLKGDVHTPLAADDIPADANALEPDATLEGKVERELDRMRPAGEPRSPTSL